jgi:hypothetical protein
MSHLKHQARLDLCDAFQKQIGSEWKVLTEYKNEIKRDYEGLALPREFKKVWEVAIDCGIHDRQLNEQEEIIRDLLVEDYAATNFEFDRIAKVVRFEIEYEKIEI